MSSRSPLEAGNDRGIGRRASPTMKAMVYREYGLPEKVLHPAEVTRPAPESGEVGVRVLGSAVNPGDWFWLNGLPYAFRPLTGLTRPRNPILGLAVAGVVDEIGPTVGRFQPGEEIYAEIWFGGFAEYAVVPEDRLAPKPSNLSFPEAAAVPVVGTTALQALRDVGKVQPGQTVLINGASGGVGTFAVQIAKWLGAEVTGVCSTANVDLVSSIGADHVVDYKEEDFTHGGRRYDLILDNVGNRRLSEIRRALTRRGMLIPNSGMGGRWLGSLPRMLAGMVTSPFVSQKIRLFAQKVRGEDLVVMKDLIESGVITPVIDRTYPFDQVAQALGHYGGGHTRGKVVITM